MILNNFHYKNRGYYMPNLDKKDTINDEIQLITNHRVLFTRAKGAHYYKGNIITQSNNKQINKSGNFDIINKRPIDINNNKVNNIKTLNNNGLKQNQEINSERKSTYDSLKLSKLNDFINRNHDNIVVLAGAGSSIQNVNKKYNTGLSTKDLAKKVNIELKDESRNYYDLIQMAIISDFKHLMHIKKRDKKHNKVYISIKYTQKLKETLNGKNLFKQFEDLLSNVNDFENYVNTLNLTTIICNVKNNHSSNSNLNNEFPIKVDTNKYRHTIKRIHMLIRRYCYLIYHDDCFSHADFINKLNSLTVNDSRLKIYSTNYDTLFEQAATSNKDKMVVIDGFSYSMPRCFKDNVLNMDFVFRKNDDKELNSNNTKLCPNVIKIFQLHGAVNWYRNKSTRQVYKTTYRNSSKKIGYSTSNTNYDPCMIFPSSNKYRQSYDSPYFDFFFNFQRDLRKKNTLLIIVGFSLSDNHIRRMVYNAMLANSSLNMIFLSHSGLIKKNHKKPLGEFYSEKLLPRELFYKADLGSFTNDVDLNYIYNK